MSQRFLRFDPEDAAWPDRDRVVLSVGYASALLHGLLHLCGVKAAAGLAAKGGGLAVTMADPQNVRQAGSRCTGHPEHDWAAGVATATRPLGLWWPPEWAWHRLGVAGRHLQPPRLHAVRSPRLRAGWRRRVAQAGPDQDGGSGLVSCAKCKT